MKKLLATLTLLMGMAMCGQPATASDIVLLSSSVVNRILVPTQNVDLDLNQYHVDSLSVQVVASSAAPSTISFGDGTVGSGSILVAGLSGLTTAYATNKITVVSTTGVSGLNIFINGDRLQEGVRWTLGATSSATARNICDRLNRDYGTIFRSTVQPTGSVVFSTAVTAGTAANAYTCASSTPAAITCNTAFFFGGQDAVSLTLNNVELRANRDWQLAASTIATARNISAAINANSQLKTVAISSHTQGVVTATATTVGVQGNFTCVSSSAAALTCSGAAFTGGANSNITLSTAPSLFGGFFNFTQVFAGTPYGPTNTINVTPTRIGNGTRLLFSTVTITAPTPLINQTTYFASNVTATSFQLADTATGAAAGLSITITTTTQTGRGTYTLTSLNLSGTPSWKLQKSNDGTNFTDVYFSSFTGLTPIQATASMPSPYVATSALWDIGDVAFRFLRFVFTGDAQGSVNINYIVNGKRK